MQVVGVLESAGMEFDCLWVSGLTEENWPLKARPHPFLPVALQRKAGIPEAAAETSLALDRRITQGWLAAADEVVLSWPEKDGDRDLLPSPLIADVAGDEVEFAVVCFLPGCSLFGPRNSKASRMKRRRRSANKRPRRHARARRPGGLPVPRLCAPPLAAPRRWLRPPRARTPWTAAPAARADGATMEGSEDE